MNVLSFALRVKIVNHLVEGCGIRPTARLCGADKDAVMHLGVLVGEGCALLHDKLVRNVRASILECDEVWAYVGKHARRKLPTDPEVWGDHYTLFGTDPVSKLVPSYLTTASRDVASGTVFACDLRKRVVGKPQVNVDGWPHWPECFRRAFGWNGVDLGVIVKEYENDTDPTNPARKYSPGRVKSVSKRPALGVPDLAAVSTSLAERVNLTTRMQQRRLTRLTNAYSKKPENLRAAMALHFMHYNFVRVHEALGTTPAVAAGLADAPWSLSEMVAAALDAIERKPETPAPAPAPAPTEPTTPAPLPTWGTWRAPVQGKLPGVDRASANDAGDDDDAPATVRDPIPWGEGAAV